jgi:hypothetical protein
VLHGVLDTPRKVDDDNVPITSPRIGAVPAGGFGQVPTYPGPQAEEAAPGPLRTTPPKFRVPEGRLNGAITTSEEAPVAVLLSV